MRLEETPFRSGWVSVRLPGYREDRSRVFTYDMLPPLNQDLFHGDFQWMLPLGTRLQAKLQPYQPTPEEREQLQANFRQIVTDSNSINLPLPQSFLEFMSKTHLQDRMPISNFYFGLSQHLSKSTIFENCYFIRFLREYQGPLKWFLYLKPNGDHCVIVSLGVDFNDEHPLRRWLATGEQITLEWVMENTFFCAPSFEEFIYRFWLEHHIFIALSEGGDLSEEQKQYLSYYRRSHTE